MPRRAPSSARPPPVQRECRSRSSSCTATLKVRTSACALALRFWSHAEKALPERKGRGSAPRSRVVAPGRAVAAPVDRVAEDHPEARVREDDPVLLQRSEALNGVRSRVRQPSAAVRLFGELQYMPVKECEAARPHKEVQLLPVSLAAKPEHDAQQLAWQRVGSKLAASESMRRGRCCGSLCWQCTERSRAGLLHADDDAGVGEASHPASVSRDRRRVSPQLGPGEDACRLLGARPTRRQQCRALVAELQQQGQNLTQTNIGGRQVKHEQHIEVLLQYHAPDSLSRSRG